MDGASNSIGKSSCHRIDDSEASTNERTQSSHLLLLLYSVLGPYKGGLRFHPTVDEGGKFQLCQKHRHSQCHLSSVVLTHSAMMGCTTLYSAQVPRF